MRSLRRGLDALYLAGGALGAACMVAILLLIAAQMVARWTGQVLPGATDYAGYAMAGSAFLALAYAMDRGAHIRVNLVLMRFGRWRRYAEIWCYGAATVIACFFAWYAVRTNIGSAKWNDISQGLDATPLWIPQIVMSVGTVVLAIAMFDQFMRILLTRHEGVEGEEGWVGLDHTRQRSRLIAAVLTAAAIALSIWAIHGIEAGILFKTVLFLFVLFFLLGSGVWVGLALIGVAYFGMAGFTSRPPGPSMITTIWTTSSSWTLTALPLFIWMGEILFRTRLSEDMFKGLAPWMARLPGGLLHTNVVGCTIFAAVSGSSAATLVTVGKMSVPELQKRGYPEYMTIGTLAGAATLGLMIPPSLILIVYGVAINESITQLFMAGVFPGLVLAALFMLYVIGWHYVRPEQRPDTSADRLSLRQMIWNSRFLIPVVMLVILVIGSMYVGYATATEAAAIGVLGSLILAAAQGSLNWRSFSESLLGATRTSAMIMLILMGAAFLSLSMGFTGLPRTLAEWIGGLDLSAIQLIAALTVFYIILGCFLDGISAVVLTMAIVDTMVREAGIDMIWFGVFVVVVVEMAQITPPVGFNLFVLQGMTGHNIVYVAKTAAPMFLIMGVMVAILVAFPELATWLPENLRQRGGG
jgi:tripartite ATP-independent transporter DctM subunit